MKRIKTFFVLCFLWLGILLYGAPLHSKDGVAYDFVLDEILVKYKDGKIERVKLEQNEELNETLKKYKSNSNVTLAEPNYLYKATLIPTDTHYTNQWYLQKINAFRAWNKVNTSPDIVIAIIDSGIQINHPDLRENIWQNSGEVADNGIDDDRNGFIDDVNGWDFIGNTPDPNPRFEAGFTEAGVHHGTIIAGIAAASGNNAAGIAGITWQAQIMPLRVLDDKGEGTTIEVIKAVDYAIANGADIINFSFVGFGFSQGLQEAIERAYRAGIIIVAAAGNEQAEGEGFSLDEVPMYPACHDGPNGENMVIGVAATDDLERKASFSSFGTNCVDMTAPGVSIFSTAVYAPLKSIDGKPFDQYYNGYWSGTSMAAPMVSGTVALIESINQKVNQEEVVEILLSNTDNINRFNPDFVGQLGQGRLNVYRAVDRALRDLIDINFKLLVAPYSGRASQVKLTDYNGQELRDFEAYGQNFRGGASVTSGDVDGDGMAEIITGAGFTGGPHVRIFDQAGNVKRQFFAYHPNFRGGVNVAAGDVDGDGIDEIITGAGFTGGPHVRIFDTYGRLKGQFFAYNKNFRGGVNVAAGDVDGDGITEIITGAGVGGGPQVRIFDLRGNVKGQFFAYDENFRGGVRVAVADIDGGVARRKDEIITAPGQGGGPHIRVFDNKANLKAQFFAYNKNFRGGVDVEAEDIDQDGLAEIITGAGPGGTPHVRVFELNGKLLGSFLAYENDFSGGVSVGVIGIK